MTKRATITLTAALALTVTLASPAFAQEDPTTTTVVESTTTTVADLPIGDPADDDRCQRDPALPSCRPQPPRSRFGDPVTPAVPAPQPPGQPVPPSTRLQPAAVAVPAEPELAYTGTDETLALFGAGLVALGILLAAAARRFRTRGA